MRIIAKKTLVAFYTMHPDAKTALEEWYEKTTNAEWENFSHVRAQFNIKGNDYRLVTIVLFKAKMVFIRFVGTHDEYAKIKDIKNI